jgi:hypothetical protein
MHDEVSVENDLLAQQYPTAVIYWSEKTNRLNILRLNLLHTSQTAAFARKTFVLSGEETCHDFLRKALVDSRFYL